MIIKCPECGHQISDKAPVCPSCGVEIAGKIVRCPNCGEIHFISDGICPNCHHSLRPDNLQATTDDEASETTANGYVPTPPTPPTKPTPPTPSANDEPVEAIPIAISRKKESGKPTKDNNGQPQKKSHWPLIVSVIIAVIICLVLLFAYNNANRDNEEREYRTAIESRDPGILQSYLNTYLNAPTAHRDSVKALLNAIRASDPQWDNLKNSTAVAALQAYLRQNPNSPHKQQVLSMIDELDWKAALQTHDFANYLSLHQNGKYAPQAVDSVKLTIDMPATEGDKEKAVASVRNFLQAINAHNSEKVMACMAQQLEFFNEKSGVPGDEALNYMAIIYKNADRLNWHVDNADAAKVSKTGNGASAQYSISMPARLSVNYTSGNNVQANYRVQARINADGKITAIKLIKQAEQPKADEKKPQAKTEEKKKETKNVKTEEKKKDSKETKKKTETKEKSKTTASKKQDKSAKK